MDKLVQTLGITGLSKSQVSVMAKELDEHVCVPHNPLLVRLREGGNGTVPRETGLAKEEANDEHRSPNYELYLTSLSWSSHRS